jgi:hypothetical protein
VCACGLFFLDAARNVSIGVWRSLASALVWDEEVAGSNPVAPTKHFKGLQLLPPWPLSAGATELQRFSLDFGGKKVAMHDTVNRIKVPMD